MSILKDLFTAIRGNVSNVGESIIDHQAITILEQSIRDGANNIAKSKTAVRDLKAQAILQSKKVADIDEDIAGYTAKTKQALAAGNEGLARKAAERIAGLQNDRVGYAENAEKLNAQVDSLYARIQSFEKQLGQERIDLENLKSVEAVQKVQQTIAAATPDVGSDRKRVERAKNRVAKRQADAEARMEANDFLAAVENGSDLDAELAAAGIGEQKTTADDILASLR